MSLSVGSVCVKLAGRKAGERVIVLGLDREKGFAVVIGERIRRKRCNLRHLLPLGKVVKVPRNVSQKDVARLLGE